MNASDQQQLNDCIDLLKTVFGGDLLGVYLYGSALLGGLQKYSDIDLFVVTNRAPTNKEKEQLVANLLELSGIYMKSSQRPIEMTLVEKSAISPWKYPSQFDFQYGEWMRDSFLKGEIEESQANETNDLAFMVTMLFLRSQTLWGEDPEMLLDRVPYGDFMRSMLNGLQHLYEGLESDTRNVLLTYARIWSTLKTNVIRSKPAAADWVMNHLPEKYQPVMKKAKAICIGEVDESWNDVQEHIRPCADYILENITDQVESINFDDPNLSISL